MSGAWVWLKDGHHHLRRVRDRLHADPDRGDRRLLLQRPARASSTSPGKGFTLEHWKNAFGIEELNEALIQLAPAGRPRDGRATILGTLIALALVRYEFRGRKATNLLIVIPMATPEIVIGASLLSMFVYSASARASPRS